MQLSGQQLQLADGEEAIAYRGVVAILRNDPVLQPLVKTFLAQLDTHEELLDPTYQLCPYLRIDPAPMTSNWITERQHKSDMVLDVTLATQGLDVVSLMNFWCAIRHALTPQDQVQYLKVVQFMRDECKILNFEFIFAPYRSARGDEGLRFRVGVGRIRCGLFLGT